MADLVVKKISTHLDRDLTLPLGELIAVTGVSASGKSRFFELISTQLGEKKSKRKSQSVVHDRFHTVASAVGLSLPIARVFAETASARRAGLKAESFLLEKPEGRCEMCHGTGIEKIDLEGYGLVVEECPHCFGRRYSPAILLVTFADKSIADLLDLTIGALREIFATHRVIAPLLESLCMFDLDQIVLGQQIDALSQSQRARLELAGVVLKKQSTKNILCLEQPFADLSKTEIIEAMRRIRAWVSQRRTLLFTTHDPVVIRNADRVIEFEPQGRVIFFGRPTEYGYESFYKAGERLRTGA